MHHIYLSPHLDDAVLAAGGLIYRQREQGEPVTVMTLCAASPQDAGLSSLAQACQAAWHAGLDPVADRRAEDRIALGQWQVQVYHGPTPDSIYRHAGARFLYPDMSSLFDRPATEEVTALPAAWRCWLDTLNTNLTQSIIYAPLAAGNHVDHQLVRVLAQTLVAEGKSVWFYEDFPHAEKPGALQAARAWFGPVVWQSQTFRINLAAKVNGIRGYTSQVPYLFGSEAAMPRRVRQFTAETACAISRGEQLRKRLAGAGGRRERLWRALFGDGAYAERIWSYA
jgi:LmbE family N-acetylglucosaminyl deacetylase